MNKKLSIRTLLILIVSIFVTIVVFLTSYLSYRYHTRSTNSLITSSARNLNLSIYNEISSFFREPVEINTLNSRLIRNKLLDVNNQSKLMDHFSAQMRAFNSATSISFANPEGGLANAGVEKKMQQYYVIYTDGFKSGVFNKYAVDEQFQKTELMTRLPHFDARIRPWFKKAIAHDDLVWGDPYLMATEHDLGINSSLAVRNEKDELIGVVCVDLFLSDISSFLARIDLDMGVKTFIMDTSGLMVASSQKDNLFSISPQDKQSIRMEALLSESKFVRSTAGVIQDRFADFAKITTEVDLSVRIANSDYLVFVKPFNVINDQSWLIVTLLPRTSFMQQVYEINKFAMFALLIVLLGSVIIAILLARMITKPILSLDKKIQATSKGDWSVEPIPTRITEIDDLASVFYLMQTTIQNNIEVLNKEIKQRKSMEEALIVAKENAEENNRLKSSFLSNMSHELRTPLNGILGFSEILIEELKTKRKRDMATMIHSSGLRLLQTLDMVLDLSRVEANKQEIKWTKVDLNRLLFRVVTLFQPGAIKKNLSLTFVPSTPGLSINSDSLILEHIVNELIGNAVKYTNEGSIIVSVDRQGIDGGDRVVISVQDSGIGISKENQEMAFEPFRQVSEGWDRSYEGTGLGLSLCTKYTKLLGGEITLESELGQGCIFKVSFPATLLVGRDPEQHEEEDIPISHPPVIKVESTFLPKILLVDDDYLCFSLVSKMLSKYAVIHHTASGAEGIAKIKSFKYAAILLDINLKSGFSGFDVLDEIRRRPAYNGIPVIAITAYAMKGDREALMERGFTDYISKPFAKEHLISIVSKWV